MKYGRVRMRAIMAIGDSVDPDETPDVAPIPSSAKVHFTPPTYALRTLVPGPDGLAVTISQQAKVTATFDAEGYLCTCAGQSSHTSTWNEVARQGQGDATQVATSIDWTGAVTLSAAEARPGAFIVRRLSGAATLTLPAGETGVAHSCTLQLTQDATGGRTLTIPGARTPYGVAPVMSTAAGAIDILTLLWDGAAWSVLVSGQAMAVPA